MFNYFNFKNHNRIINFSIYIYIALTIYILFISNHFVNRDGILYLKQSFLIFNLITNINSLNDISNDIEKILSLHNNYIYSFMIACVKLITNLTYEKSAYVINFIHCIFIYLFFSKISLLYFKKNEYSYLPLVVFTSLYSFLIDYIPMIIRDLGSIVGFLGAVYFLIRYFDTKKIKLLIYSLISLFYAGLFRHEYLIILFLIVFLMTMHYLKFYLNQSHARLGIFKVIFFMIVFLIFANEFFVFNFQEYISNFIHIKKNFLLVYNNELITSNNFWLEKFFNKHLYYSLTIIALTYPVYNAIVFLNIINVFFVYNFLKNLNMVNKRNFLISILFCFFIFSFSVINFLSDFVFSTRYLLSAIILIATVIPISINNFIKTNYFLSKNISLIIFIYFALNIVIIFANSDNKFKNMTDLTIFFENHNIDLSSVYSDDNRINYYLSGISDINLDKDHFVDSVKSGNYSYLLLSTNNISSYKNFDLDNYYIFISDINFGAKELLLMKKY